MNTYQVSSLLRFDLREAFNSPLWIGYSWIYFLFQFFVYGSIMSTLVITVHDYFFYYGTGLVVLSTFNIASWSGRRFVESTHGQAEIHPFAANRKRRILHRAASSWCHCQPCKNTSSCADSVVYERSLLPCQFSIHSASAYTASNRYNGTDGFSIRYSIQIL